MTRAAMSVRIATCLVALAFATPSAEAQKPDSTLLRPTVVVVKITNDAVAGWNGTFTAKGVSTKCGLADYGYPHRAHSFAVIFPDDTVTTEVRSVNFDADTLRRGTTVSSFYLAVGTRVGARGTPPLYVVRANQPQYNEPGTAKLVRTSKGADSLTVMGTATTGTKVAVEMTLVCGP